MCPFSTWKSLGKKTFQQPGFLLRNSSGKIDGGRLTPHTCQEASPTKRSRNLIFQPKILFKFSKCSFVFFGGGGVGHLTCHGRFFFPSHLRSMSRFPPLPASIPSPAGGSPSPRRRDSRTMGNSPRSLWQISATVVRMMMKKRSSRKYQKIEGLMVFS